MKRGKGLKKWMMLYASFFILFSIVSPASQASELNRVNQQLKQLKKELDSAKNKQRHAKSLKAKATKGLKKTKKDMDILRSQIDKQTNEMANIAYKIDITKLNLEQAKDKLQRANKRIVERNNLLKGRVCSMYMDGNVPYVGVLLSAESFSDFLDRFDSLQTIASRDKEILVEHKQDKQLVVQKKQEIETNLKQERLLYAKLNHMKKQLMLKEKEKKVIIASYNQAIAESDEASEEQQRLLVEIIRKRTKLMKKKKGLSKSKRMPIRKWKGSSQVAYTGGKLALPLHGNYSISSSFGLRVDPITRRRGAFHSGLDMATFNGASIYAAEAGTIIMAEWWSGYGYCVVIDHGEGLWTLYGHIRSGGIKVKQGDEVARGERIAEVGATGRTTGNHLHFEVRLDGKQVNPISYWK